MEFVIRCFLWHKTSMKTDHGAWDVEILVWKNYMYQTAAHSDTNYYLNISYNFGINSYVALKRDCEQNRFLRRINTMFATIDNVRDRVVCNLEVHWFERYGHR